MAWQKEKKDENGVTIGNYWTFVISSYNKYTKKLSVITYLFDSKDFYDTIKSKGIDCTPYSKYGVIIEFDYTGQNGSSNDLTSDLLEWAYNASTTAGNYIDFIPQQVKDKDGNLLWEQTQEVDAENKPMFDENNNPILINTTIPIMDNVKVPYFSNATKI